MFRFSYNYKGIKIRFACKDRQVFLQRLAELARLGMAGKINNVKFY